MRQGDTAMSVLGAVPLPVAVVVVVVGVVAVEEVEAGSTIFRMFYNCSLLPCNKCYFDYYQETLQESIQCTLITTVSNCDQRHAPGRQPCSCWALSHCQWLLL